MSEDGHVKREFALDEAEDAGEAGSVRARIDGSPRCFL